MTEESSGDDERGDDAEEGSDDGNGHGPPTERDVAAAREELAAVDADGETETDGDAEADATEFEAGADAASDDAGADGTEVEAEADAASNDAEADDPAESDDAGVHDAAEPDDAAESDGSEAVNPEDLVESPEDRAVAEGRSDAPAEDGSDAPAEAGTAADAEAGAGTASDATSESPDGTGAAGASVDTDDAVEENPAGPAAAGVETGAADSQTDAATADTTDVQTGPTADAPDDAEDQPDHQPGVPEDVQKYDRFKKVDGAQYDRVNEFLRDRTYVTAREWAIARLCSDFRTETGVEMTKIGENLPELVPFMTDTYTPQAVNQARASFEEKVRTAGATFLYGAMCDFFTAEELDDVMYEATEVAKFLLEVEGVELSVEEELEAEDRISAVMRDVRESSAELRHEACPECGHRLTGEE